MIAFRRALAKTGVDITLIHAIDGQEALEKIPDIDEPYVAVIDLNMPRINGFELIDAIQASDLPKPDKIFVLTTSLHARDRLDAWNRHVDYYFSKDQLDEGVRVLTTEIGAGCP